eukprot:GHVR01108495.1.p1 GENE.GHVR01108495.1~~GHVR01108495.1.p1  ORF type:complete len:199 (+),score=38.98 GHVR01108495.1:117-713(+)
MTEAHEVIRERLTEEVDKLKNIRCSNINKYVTRTTDASAILKECRDMINNMITQVFKRKIKLKREMDSNTLDQQIETARSILSSKKMEIIETDELLLRFNRQIDDVKVKLHDLTNQDKKKQNKKESRLVLMSQLHLRWEPVESPLSEQQSLSCWITKEGVEPEYIDLDDTCSDAEHADVIWSRLTHTIIKHNNKYLLP